MKVSKDKHMQSLHNVRFYNLQPRAINSLAYSKRHGKIAASRSDSSIEIWDINYAPVLEKTIFPIKNNTVSIEDIVWSDERLFSGDLSGEIVEYDLSTLGRKQAQFVTGNSIWCLDINAEQTNLAAGTEEGYLNIFDITDGNLIYNTVFDKQEGRILCCKYSKNSEFLVTGSLDVIRIWSTKTGHAIRKMTTGRSESKKETIVWSLQVLWNFTIIAGDSRGQLTIWNGNNGTQIENHQAFEKDILAVTVNEDENILICAGVEPVIRIYCLTPITKNQQILQRWVKYIQRRVHDHDVKALVCAGLKIISGGVDGYLGFSSHSKMHHDIKKYAPFLQTPCVSVSSQLRFILFRYPNYLEIWKLGSKEENNMPEKLLQMKSKNNELIICSVLSSNGAWLLYSTVSDIRVFAIKYEEEKFKIDKIKILPEQFTPSLKALFSNNSKYLFLFKANKKIDIFNVETNEIDFIYSIDCSKYIKEICHIADISTSGKYLVVASTCNKICVWKKGSQNQWKHYLNLPKYFAPVTALSLHPESPKLVVTFSDSKIFQYDLTEMRFTFSTTLNDKETTSSHCVKNILLNVKNENRIVLQNENHLFSYELQIHDDNSAKKKKLKENNSEKEEHKLKLKLKKPYDHLIELKWISEDELIAVGVHPVSLIEVLPNVFRKKTFGAS